MKAVRFDGVVLADTTTFHYDLILKLRQHLVKIGKYADFSEVDAIMEKHADRLQFGFIIEKLFCDYNLLPFKDQTGVDAIIGAQEFA